MPGLEWPDTDPPGGESSARASIDENASGMTATTGTTSIQAGEKERPIWSSYNNESALNNGSALSSSLFRSDPMVENLGRPAGIPSDQADNARAELRQVFRGRTGLIPGDPGTLWIPGSRAKPGGWSRLKEG